MKMAVGFILENFSALNIPLVSEVKAVEQMTKSLLCKRSSKLVFSAPIVTPIH